MNPSHSSTPFGTTRTMGSSAGKVGADSPQSGHQAGQSIEARIAGTDDLGGLGACALTSGSGRLHADHGLPPGQCPMSSQAMNSVAFARGAPAPTKRSSRFSDTGQLFTISGFPVGGTVFASM